MSGSTREKGIVFLDKLALPLVDRGSYDTTFAGLLLLRKILDQIDSSAGFQSLILATKKLKPKDHEPQDWTAEIMKEGETFSKRFEKIKILLLEVSDCKIQSANSIIN